MHGNKIEQVGKSGLRGENKIVARILILSFSFAAFPLLSAANQQVPFNRASLFIMSIVFSLLFSL